MSDDDGRGQRRGPAAVIGAAMLADGVDLHDDAAVQAWIAAFNDLPYEERIELLSDEVLGEPTAGMVELPDEDTARASAAGARLLIQLRDLVEFVGEGRALTKTGNVTLADARSLLDLLETGDVMDGAIGDRVFKTVSAADLPGLSTVVRVARKARFVRALKGKLLATKAGRALGRDPLADLQRVVAAVDEGGMCSLRYGADGDLYSALAPFFDGLFVPLMSMVVADPGAVPLDALVDGAFQVFDEEVELPYRYWEQAEHRRALVQHQLTTGIELLESAGVLVWDSETESTALGTTRRTGGTVRATPAGRWTLYHHLTEEHGVPLGTVGPPAHTEGGFVELVEAVVHEQIEGPAQLQRELTAWVEHRGRGAIAELVEVARTADDAMTRSMAVATLGGAFGPGVEAEMRALLDDPVTRAAALLWLVEEELEPPEALLDRDPAVLADILGLVLVQRGVESMLDVFEHLGTAEDQIAMLQQLWRQPHEAMADVLELLGRHHPQAKVAKAARKAMLQHNSFLANQPHR